MIGIRTEAGLLFRKFITSKTSFLIKVRNLSNIDLANERESFENRLFSELRKIKKCTKNTSNTLEVLEHLKNKNHSDELTDFPKNLLKKTKHPSHLYLFNSSTAEQIINLIKDDIMINPSKVIEVNPGMGILTKQLLAIGIPSLTLMEPNAHFMKILEDLQLKHPKEITLQRTDFFSMWRLAYRDKKDNQNRVLKVFSDFPKVQWEDEHSLKIIGTITNANFIKHIIMDIVKQCGIISFGRPCCYLCMPPSVWLTLTCDNRAGLHKYRSMSVLFQLLFDFKILGQVARNVYIPCFPTLTSKEKSTAKYKMDEDYMYVVKIEAKKNLYTEVIDKKHLHLLWYFVKQQMVVRTGKVIAQMEAWEPNCGPKLIKKDYTVFTQFGDLSPQQILELFKEFSTWDSFHNSFIPSLGQSLEKEEQLLF